MHKTIPTNRIIYAYRYFSWALTSLIYIAAKPYHVIHYKLGVILSLLIFSIFINNIYQKNNINKTSFKTLVLIETIGIELLLLPTGGLTSPFIWYALNPILISAIYLSSYFSWINLIFYLITGSAMTFLLFNSNDINLLHIILNNLNLILIFVLINFAVRILSVLTNELKQSNIEKEELIEHMMSLYQMIETLNNHSSKENLFEALVKYTEKLTNNNTIIFWLNEDNLLKSNREFNNMEIDSIIEGFKNLIIKNEIQHKYIINARFILFPIMSASTYYGVVAFQYSFYETNRDERLLRFISELSAVILERFEQEGIEEHLSVMEEQNRIADEMHDSVSQRLFSISYGIHGILGRIEKLTTEEIKEYLSEIQLSSDLAMKELRNSIYKLSSKKKGEKYLQNTINNFLHSISKLQDICTLFEVDGDESYLTIDLKKGLIRIIKEACGNAVRHGKCKNICINLCVADNLILLIKDDGVGFLINNYTNNGGIGFSNMKHITNSFGGSINIDSIINEGTKIEIIIPIKGHSFEKKGSLAV